MTRAFLLLAALAIAGCITTTYVAAPPPPCMPDAAKLELVKSCGDTLERCPGYSEYLRDFVKWRNGVFGERLCKAAKQG